MLVKCKTKSDKFIQIYDSEDLKDLHLEDFGLSDIENISKPEQDLPIYPLNDVILSQISKKSTSSQKLENCGIYTFYDLSEEYLKILAKESRLSRSQRDLVVFRFKEIANVIASEEEQDTSTVSD